VSCHKCFLLLDALYLHCPSLILQLNERGHFPFSKKYLQKKMIEKERRSEDLDHMIIDLPYHKTIDLPKGGKEKMFGGI